MASLVPHTVALPELRLGTESQVMFETPFPISITDLPFELILETISYLGDQADQSNFAKTCHRFHMAFVPKIYSTFRSKYPYETRVGGEMKYKAFKKYGHYVKYVSGSVLLHEQDLTNKALRRQPNRIGDYWLCNG